MVSDASTRQSHARNPAVKVGLVGAREWAATMHAPLHSAGAETEFAGVWSASGSTAKALAAEHGVRAFGTFEELLGGFLDGGFLNTGFPAGKATEGWREELGVLYDLGPHRLDLMELAAGPVQAVRAEATRTMSP